MASYDVDRFRAFVMSPSFNDTYDIPVDVMALLIADDEALLDFGLNFLRHTLFGGVEAAGADARHRWLQQVRNLGAHAA